MNGDPQDGAMRLGIKVFQNQSPAMTKDGFVSPFNKHAFGSPGVFTLSLMQGTIIAKHAGANAVWPRMDKINGCPGELAMVIKREVGILQMQNVA